MKWIHWISAHWLTVTLSLVVATSLINATTKHYGERSPRLRRFLAWLLDVLSILQSKGSPSSGLKLPLATSPKPPHVVEADLARAAQKKSEMSRASSPPNQS